MSLLRKIADEKDARACLSSLAQSGGTLRAWAKRHGVDGRSLRAWQEKLPRPASLAPGRLVELVPLSSTSRPLRRYLVHVGMGSVEVGDDFDDRTLRRVLEVLRAC